MKRFNITIALLLAIVFFALFIRIYLLSEIPASLNPDEAALGYTSYSFLKTGADEHGKFLPLSIQSFGDWKLPLYSYIGILPVGVMGLSEFSIRFPSMLAGTIGVVLIFFISLSLFKRKEIALLSALFFALSPWNIYFSRAAYEVNLATTIFLGGLLAFLTYFDKGQKNQILIIVAFFLLALPMFTQHSFIVFSPLFTLSLLFIYRNKIKWGKTFISGIGLFLLLVSMSFISNAFGGSQKISNLVVLDDKDILYERVDKFRGDNSEKSDLVERMLHMKYLGVPYHITQNYVNTYSPEFLFDKGGEKLVHNLGGFGNLYLFDVLLLLVGFAGLFWYREKSLAILIAWLLLGPIPSIVTKDTPNSTRLFQMMPLFVLVASYGGYCLFQYLRVNKQRQFVGGVLILLFCLNIIFFVEVYFVHFNNQRMRFWRFGYREAVKLAQEYPDHKIVMRGPENFPYVYFLFYNEFDPEEFRREVKYFPKTQEGFYFVKSFDRYEFTEKIDYANLKSNTIYIDDTVPQNSVDNIYLPSGEPILTYRIID